MRGKLFKPDFIVMMKSRFVIINKYRRSYVHCVDKDQAFPDSTFSQAIFDLGSYVNEFPPGPDIEPEFLSV